MKSHLQNELLYLKCQLDHQSNFEIEDMADKWPDNNMKELDSLVGQLERDAKELEARKEQSLEKEASGHAHLDLEKTNFQYELYDRQFDLELEAQELDRLSESEGGLVQLTRDMCQARREVKNCSNCGDLVSSRLEEISGQLEELTSILLGESRERPIHPSLLDKEGSQGSFVGLHWSEESISGCQSEGSQDVFCDREGSSEGNNPGWIKREKSHMRELHPPGTRRGSTSILLERDQVNRVINTISRRDGLEDPITIFSRQTYQTKAETCPPNVVTDPKNRADEFVCHRLSPCQSLIDMVTDRPSQTYRSPTQETCSVTEASHLLDDSSLREVTHIRNTIDMTDEGVLNNSKTDSKPKTNECNRTNDSQVIDAQALSYEESGNIPKINHISDSRFLTGKNKMRTPSFLIDTSTVTDPISLKESFCQTDPLVDLSKKYENTRQDLLLSKARMRDLSHDLEQAEAREEEQAFTISLLTKQMEQLQRERKESSSKPTTRGSTFIIKDLQSQVQALEEKSRKKDSLIKKLAEVVCGWPEESLSSVVEQLGQNTIKPSDRRIDFDIQTLVAFLEQQKVGFPETMNNKLINNEPIKIQNEPFHLSSTVARVVFSNRHEKSR